MPDNESTVQYRTRTLRTSEVTETSAAALRGAATDRDLWEKWLTVVANHPKESANNCASIMSSPYKDTRELRTAEEWEDCGGAVKEDAQFIPFVKRSEAGNFYVELVYPAEAVEAKEGMKEQFNSRYRGLTKKINLDDRIDGIAYTNACLKYASDFEGIDPNVNFIIETRYGIPPANEPELPSIGIAEDPKALAQYCRSIQRDAANLIFKLDNTIRSQRYHLSNPTVRVVEKPVEKAVKTEEVTEAMTEQTEVEAEEEPVVEKAEAPKVAEPVKEQAPAPKPRFDAAAHTSAPSDIYSAAAAAAKSASASQDSSRQLPLTQ